MNNLITKQIIHIADTNNVITDVALKRLINSFLGKTGVNLDDDIKAGDLSATDFINAAYDGAITSNKVSKLDGLNNALALEGLEISENEITDITPLKNITTLTFLAAEGNKITNLQEINENIKILELGQNGIRDISGINKASGITELNLAGNEIEDISELAQLTALNKVVLTNNKIADVSSLNGFQFADSQIVKWAALGGQIVELSPVYYEKDNNKIIISWLLDGQLKDLQGNVPSVIKNIIYKDLKDGIAVKGTYDSSTKTVKYEIDEIPKLVSFDFNTTTDNTISDSYSGNASSYVAIKIENEDIKDYINEKIQEAGGTANNPILYKDYKAAAIDNLKQIDLSNKGLSSLKGVDLFPGAIEINADNNGLVDMSDLFKLINIKTINVSAENQSNTFDDTSVIGQSYIFNLNKLSVNEVNNKNFQVAFEVSEISHKGVYDSTTNTIKWTGLYKDEVLTFKYRKIYKEPSAIGRTSIGALAAGDPYNNIINNGTAIINLSVSVTRGLDLF